MHLNLSSDRLLHLLVLVVASAFFGFIVQYWTESGLLFSFSGGVTIAVQLSNAIEKFRTEGETSDSKEMPDEDGRSDTSSGDKPNRKKVKGAQRRHMKVPVGN